MKLVTLYRLVACAQALSPRSPPRETSLDARLSYRTVLSECQNSGRPTTASDGKTVIAFFDADREHGGVVDAIELIDFCQRIEPK